MNRFRCPLRLRAALALVAVAAAAMGAVRLARTRAEYLSRAEYHAGWELGARDLEEWWDGMIVLDRKVSKDDDSDSMVPEYRRKKEAYHARAEYHAALRRKYEHAASSPWLSVTPDPTKPLGDTSRLTRSEWEDQRVKYPWLPAEPAEGFSTE